MFDIPRAVKNVVIAWGVLVLLVVSILVGLAVFVLYNLSR